MYHVTVYRRQLHTRKFVKTDHAEFPIGEWMQIGYWLDEFGYIEEDCKVEVRISEN